MKKRDLRVLVRNFAIELLVYSILVLSYSFIVLRLLSEPLCRLFDRNLWTYAFVALGLIVAQGALLDVITSFLLKQLPVVMPE